MNLFAERVAGRERLRILCALAFWAATYLLFVAWNQLQDVFPPAIWQTRRLLATGFGALLFYAYTLLADRLAGRQMRERLWLLAGAALACFLTMVLFRAAIDWLIVPVLGEPTSTWERHLRFGLIWGGYFVGGALAFVSSAQPQEDRPAEAEAERPLSPSHPDSFWVSRGRETVRVPVATLEWVEAEGDYVRLHAGSGGGLMRATLSGLEETLDPSVFMRVHRSAICRKELIAAMLRKPSGALAVRLETGAEIPVGRRYRDAVTALIDSQRNRVGRLPA